MSSRVDRLLRWVWLVNGVLLLGLVIVALLFVGGMWITDLLAGDPGVPVAETSAPDEGERAGAVRYDTPDRIAGTETRIVRVRRGQGEARPVVGSSSYERDASGPVVNVGFLDARGARLLLDWPGYVAEVRYPGGPGETAGDSLLRWVVYELALEDGNRDGRLDHRDARTLYVSELDGSGLRRVLPPGLRLLAWTPQPDRTLLVTALQGPAGGAPGDEAQWPQRAFVFDGTAPARSFAALDSLAAAAGGILRK